MKLLSLSLFFHVIFSPKRLDIPFPPSQLDILPQQAAEFITYNILDEEDPVAEPEGEFVEELDVLEKVVVAVRCIKLYSSPLTLNLDFLPQNFRPPVFLT